MGINFDKKIISGHLVYATIAEPVKKYESEELEYKIGILVNEDAADAWDEKFPKQPATKFKVSDFEEKFRFDVPAEFEDERNVYLINVKQSVNADPKLNEQYRPRVFLESIEDGAKIRTDITLSRLIANGSQGKVSFRVLEHTKYGLIAYLQNILIPEDKFKEYTASRPKAGSEFDDDDDTPVVIRKEAEQESATKARANAAKEVKEDAPAKKAARTTKKETPKPSVDEVDPDADAPF